MKAGGSMPSKITSRIVAETGIPRLFSVLAEEISPGDLQSLLLSVYQSRVRTMPESEVFRRSEQSTLMTPSSIEARLLNGFDRIAFVAAEGFEGVDLSPVGPLGTHFVLGAIDQNNVLTTIRNAELLGDPTPAMALECARRRKSLAHRVPHPPVQLCTSHRAVRLQPFDFPDFTPHFRLFGLVSAGRDTGSSCFEIDQLGEHIRFYLRFFRALSSEGFSLTSPLVEISDLNITEVLLGAAGSSRDQVRQLVRAHKPGSAEHFLAERGITLPTNITDPKVELRELARQYGLDSRLSRLVLLKQRMIDPIQAEYPEAQLRFNLARLEGLGYYSGLCLRISPVAPDGVRYPIADGGLTDWTARLLQDNKERLLTSGIGSEFVCRRYRIAP
jgi:Histidyl-tRNA synthetase